MSKKSAKKVKFKTATLVDWLFKCGDFAALTVRVLNGVPVLHHAKINEYYVVPGEKK